VDIDSRPAAASVRFFHRYVSDEGALEELKGYLGARGDPARI